MRTLSLIALIAATASPALAAPTPTSLVPDTVIGARDAGDREDRAMIFETSELSGSERTGDPRTRARDPGDVKDRAMIFDIAELSADERRGVS